MNALASTVVSAVFVAAISAQESSRTERTVQRMIERLDDPRAELADTTMLGLIRGGTASAPLLRAMLAKAESPDVRARIERALAICAVNAPIINGLKLGLRADRSTAAFGETVEFTATLCNVSDAPITIYLGMSYSGNVLENGLALRELGSRAEDSPEQGRFWVTGFCGTGAYRLVVKLEPWTSREFSTQAWLETGEEKEGFVIDSDPHLSMGLTYLPLPPNSKSLRLQLHHKIDDKCSEDIARSASKDARGAWVYGVLRKRRGCALRMRAAVKVCTQGREGCEIGVQGGGFCLDRGRGARVRWVVVVG